MFIKFLYGTIPGRLLLKLLAAPWVSKIAGCFLSSAASRWMISPYIRKHRIDMKNIEVPENGFSSFNAFFVRKRRCVSYELSYEHLLSPCDGHLTIADIEENMVFSIKNTVFSLEDLLCDGGLAEKFRRGTAFIFRLMPADYHRYCYAADGDLICAEKIPGKLHCVRPVALRSVPVFVQNSREYQVLRTDAFGVMVQMEIGALLVGKIHNHREYLKTGRVQAGEEKGYFEFGGSTIVLLVQKDIVTPNTSLYERKDGEGEMQVQMGEAIAALSFLKKNGGRRAAPELSGKKCKRTVIVLM